MLGDVGAMVGAEVGEEAVVVGSDVSVVGVEGAADEVSSATERKSSPTGMCVYGRCTAQSQPTTGWEPGPTLLIAMAGGALTKQIYKISKIESRRRWLSNLQKLLQSFSFVSYCVNRGYQGQISHNSKMIFW